jgi:hypothetical protein
VEDNDPEKKKDVKGIAVTKFKHLLGDSEKNYEKLKKPAPASLELVTSRNKLGVSPLGQLAL